MIKLILFLLDWGVPRFITEEVALVDDGEYYSILCGMNDIRPDDKYEAIGVARSFNFFGRGIFPRVTDIRLV